MGKRRKEILALVLAGLLLVLPGWLEGTGERLQEDILRLHVLANSDDEADQELKLLVRDRILETADSMMVGAADRDEAIKCLSDDLPKLAQVGAETVAQAGYCYPVTVSIEKCWFPTKVYQDFALPSGRYTALRVKIGEGCGQNWWCVLFPPLCLGGATEKVEITAAMAGLNSSEISLITGEDGGYIIKFKLLELWDQFKRRIEPGKAG